MNFFKKISILMAIVTLFSCTVNCANKNSSSNPTKNLGNVKQIKNVILLIGDGMGPSQIRAGELFKGEKLYMQGFPQKISVDTTSLVGVTDSAAAATAIATGTLTVNGNVGKDNGGNDLETIVDIAESKGKRTGIITTEELYGATPMAFSGHSSSRSDYNRLIESAATTSGIDLFASYTINNSMQAIFTSNGYTKIENVDDISTSTANKVFGSYNILAKAESMSDNPDGVALDRVLIESLDYLSKDEDGFFIMAEGAHIDHGGHNNDIFYMIRELIAFDDAVKAAVEWASKRNDTVVLVTADHETGGLILNSGIDSRNMFTKDENGRYEYILWSTSGHTSTYVNFYLNGVNIDFTPYLYESSDCIKNTSIFEIMKSLVIG